MKRLLAPVFAAAILACGAVTPASAEPGSDQWWNKVLRNTEAPAPQARGNIRQRSAATSSSTPRATRTSTRTASRSTTSEPVSSGGGRSGIASYYWQPQRVASGGWFNPGAMTAAHKTLPFGTRVRVTRADNGRSVEVTINDRGPYVAGRVIDLSKRAAEVIGMTGQGITRVNVAVLGR